MVTSHVHMLDTRTGEAAVGWRCEMTIRVGFETVPWDGSGHSGTQGTREFELVE
jgi:hypothetical protein